MGHILTKFGLALVVVGAAGSVTAAPAERVLILDLNAEGGVDGSRGLQISAAIAEATSKLPRLRVLTMQDLRTLLSQEESKQLVGCGEKASCYAEVPAFENVDLLVRASAGLIGQDLTLTLALLDHKAARVRHRLSVVLDPSLELGPTVGSMVEELFDRKTGALVAFKLPEGSRSFAVFDLESAGVAPSTAINLTQVLSSEIKAMKGTSVIGRDDLKTLLDFEAQKQLVGCTSDSSCLSEIGAALGVDYLVAGHVGKVAESYIISLRLIAPQTVEVKSRVTESYVGAEEQLVGAVRHAVARLLGALPKNKSGSLRLRTVDGPGVIRLDGEVVDETALIEDLEPGRHSLHIRKSGYLDWSSEIYVAPGPETVLSVNLEERSREWHESWVLWASLIGLAVAGAGAAITAGMASGGTVDGNGLPTGVNGPNTHPFGIEVSLPER